MAENEPTKICRFCAETIKAEAKVCWHCGRPQNKSAIYLNELIADSFRRFIGKRKKIMNDNVETKTCDLCAESIRVAAKVCPYCRSFQSRWRLKKQIEQWSSLVLLLMMGFGFMIFIGNIFSPGRNFSEFQNQLTITDAEMHFSQNTNGNFISTVGQIKNSSPYAWKDLQIEVQYYNKNGHMIDTRTEDRYSEIISAGSTEAFRIRGPADKTESEYSTQKKFLRSAKDARKWP